MTRTSLRSIPGGPPTAATAVALLLLLSLFGCGDDGAGATVPSASVTTEATTVELPPTTYLISRTGVYRGNLEDVGSSSGTITFSVAETGDSTHATLAGGQVIVYDYAVVGLEVALSLVAHPCGDTTVTGEFLAVLGEPMGLDAESGFSAETDALHISGSTYQGASGTVTVFVTPEGSGEACSFGPVSWSADAG